MKPLKILTLAALMIPGMGYSQDRDADSLSVNLEGKMAPQFAGTSLNGTDWNNDKLKGKVVLLNFWFVGCPPCMKEITHFNQLNAEYADRDFVLLSIAPQVKEDLMLFNDTVQESVQATVRKYFQAEPINYEIIPACDTKLYDDPNKLGAECDNISKDFYVRGYPSTFIIDKGGTIRHVQSGFSNTAEGGKATVDTYRSTIDKLLNE